MSKEKDQNKALNKTDVSSSIFFNVPLIAYEKTELKLSKAEGERILDGKKRQSYGLQEID